MKKASIIKACATFAIAGTMALAMVGCGGGGTSSSSSAASSAASSASSSAASTAGSSASSATSASGSAEASLPGAEIGQPDGWTVDVVTPDQDVVLTNGSKMIEVKYNPASSGKAEKYISLGAENDEKEMQTTTINGNTWYYYEGYSGPIMAVDLSDGRLVVTADGLTLDEATPVLELIKIS